MTTLDGNGVGDDSGILVHGGFLVFFGRLGARRGVEQTFTLVDLVEGLVHTWRRRDSASDVVDQTGDSGTSEPRLGSSTLPILPEDVVLTKA